MTTFSGVLRLTILAGLAWSLPASAQPVKPVQHIRIRAEANQCVYRIMDQVDQDVIVVPPRGKVLFQFQGGVRGIAQITQSPDGTPGTEGGSVVTSGLGPERTLDVRRSIGRTTEHQVRIQCCMDRRGRMCNRWLDAAGADQDQDLGQHAGGPLEALSGPSAQDAVPADPATVSGPGGPKMKVQE